MSSGNVTILILYRISEYGGMQVIMRPTAASAARNTEVKFICHSVGSRKIFISIWAVCGTSVTFTPTMTV